jgi:thymidylate kinase
MMSKMVYAIEGLDRLGKSTLIEGIREKQGYYEVIHFGKPQRLEFYQNSSSRFFDEKSYETQDIQNPELFFYQRESFVNSMIMARSGARLIFDRWHLGEAVYAPLYRGYSGDYVFGIERLHRMDACHSVRLILLTEDFKVSKHFIDDGESFDVTKREQEQEMFIAAFERSIIPDKRIICVTDRDLGGFKPKSQILAEALE